MSKLYIQCRKGSKLETFRQFETRNEAYLMLLEYNLFAGIGANYYISTRCCKSWEWS